MSHHEEDKLQTEEAQETVRRSNTRRWYRLLSPLAMRCLGGNRFFQASDRCRLLGI
jgi:hypothetical protein